MRYRLYLDESGDHTSSDKVDIGKRYLGLIGVALHADNCQRLTSDIEQLKRAHLQYDPDDPPILHREDIVNRAGSFGVLRDDRKRALFDCDLLALIRNTDCRIFAVVIDKMQHWAAGYRALKHPYHYCLHAMLERYCGYLAFTGNVGDVMAESRGKKEDTALKAVYERAWASGTRYLKGVQAQRVLTSKQIKVKPKLSNSAGLQLADLLAHPLTRDVLRAYGRMKTPANGFAGKIIEVAQRKYNCHAYRDNIDGYGRVLLD